MDKSANLQQCYLCKEHQSKSNFTQRIDDRYYKMCKTCVSKILEKRNGKNKLEHTSTHRTCYLCLRFLPTSSFTRRSTGTYFSACKDCNRNVFSSRRRARKLNADGEFSTKEWRALLSLTDICPGCNNLWEDIPVPPRRTGVIDADHIIPISRGGSNWISNIQPLCYSCNSAKGDKIGVFLNGKFLETEESIQTSNGDWTWYFKEHDKISKEDIENEISSIVGDFVKVEWR